MEIKQAKMKTNKKNNPETNQNTHTRHTHTHTYNNQERPKHTIDHTTTMPTSKNNPHPRKKNHTQGQSE